MSDKIVDCIYCKGVGWNYTDLMYKKECKECGGTGIKTIKEVRKSILVPIVLHRRLKELAHEHQKSLVDFLRKVVNDYGSK